MMRKSVSRGLVLLAVIVAGTGCATSEQWKEWRSHQSHFASTEHMWFSLRNLGSTPRVTQQDQRLATAQSWWGDPVVVSAE